MGATPCTSGFSKAPTLPSRKHYYIQPWSRFISYIRQMRKKEHASERLWGLLRSPSHSTPVSPLAPRRHVAPFVSPEAVAFDDWRASRHVPRHQRLLEIGVVDRWGMHHRPLARHRPGLLQSQGACQMGEEGGGGGTASAPGSPTTCPRRAPCGGRQARSLLGLASA